MVKIQNLIYIITKYYNYPMFELIDVFEFKFNIF
jgi:hypothetical protein